MKKVQWGRFILSFLLPMVLVLLCSMLFGPQGGMLALTLYLVIFIYTQRATFLHTIARKKLAEGDDAGTIHRLGQAVAAAPKKSVYRTSLAFMMLRAGHIDIAEKELETAMQLAKTDDERNNIRSNQALVQWKQGKLTDAIKTLEDIVPYYQTTALYSTLGYFYIAAGDIDKAMAFNQTAYEFNGKNAVILDNYAWCKHLCGHTDEAIDLYKTMMSQPPTFPDAYWNYGQVLETTGEFEKAAYLYRNALSKRFNYTSTVSRDTIEERLRQVEKKAASLITAQAFEEQKALT